ncbi:putative dipeptidyl peptidase 3 [Calycina marina]|uniref:Dipeptidyl peptidase 3 n=1 Tax=Calycina marina TaxID=1763456 RepID=A0A9P7YVF4_9HELO|nr:putative dipeptidyl peptidase 3 [Calycina marina]
MTRWRFRPIEAGRGIRIRVRTGSYSKLPVHARSFPRHLTKFSLPMPLSLTTNYTSPSSYTRTTSAAAYGHLSHRMFFTTTTTSTVDRLHGIKNHLNGTMNATEIKHFLADSPPSTVNLVIKKHFDALSDKEKRYAHYISKSAFAGTRITLRQVSPESEAVFDFIIELFKSFNGDWAAAQKKSGIRDEDLKHFLEYSAQFLGNCGNYKGFGDSKFVPRCEEKAFAALAATSPEVESLYKATNGAIFSSNNNGLMHLGHLDENHVTTYYPDSEPITQAEISAISDWMREKGLLPENTRLRKKDGGFELLIASAVTAVPAEGGDIGKETEFKVDNGTLKGQTIKLVYGDYSKELAIIAGFHKKTAEEAANDNQKNMQLAYAKSFETGSLEAYKNSQRFWIRDKGPMVESNIGFVETYRDPHGVRGEWEGFAATVNLERTRTFGALVDGAESMIPKLPWTEDFEKDKFLSPDFTSLEVLSFAGSGIPAGINIPNYDDIRQTEGFKNVSLGNVLSAKAPNEKIPFIRPEDLENYLKYREPAFEIQVGIHELLGHGTGKLLQETSPGIYNFDHTSPPISPIDNKPISTYYKPGETWGGVFGAIASSYEECRAETVAMALCCDFEILRIFGFGEGVENMDNEAGDVLYAGYLAMARNGILSLEMWDAKSKKWGQAHSQARFSILKCFLAAPDNFCQLSYEKDDLSDLKIKLDRSKITTVGRKAVEQYLQKLHVYKSTADVEAGTQLYNEMTHVDEFFATKVREEVLRNKQPRKVFVQSNTNLDEKTGLVSLVEYEPTCEGMIKSYAERGV